jgi:hypothetical protein
MIISKKRQYQDTASIREPGPCRPEFCDEPVVGGRLPLGNGIGKTLWVLTEIPPLWFAGA